MRSFFRSLIQPFQARRLDLPDLAHNEALARHVALQLSLCVRREGRTSGMHSVSSCSDALRNVGLKLRMPRRASVPFIRFTMRVRSPTRLSRSRFGRLASSSSSDGIAGMLQWSRSPRSQAEKGALEQLGIEPVRLRPPMLARHGDARRVDDIGFDGHCHINAFYCAILTRRRES
jgi:hypothetical protein